MRLYVLTPSHSLEDFPTEGTEQDASSLLNAFAVIWHPALLHAANALPTWHRADEPPFDPDGDLILVPKVSEDWLPGGWVKTARDQGAAVVLGCTTREEYAEAIRAAGEPFSEMNWETDPERTADCYALGSCWLQLELLTRQMHHFSHTSEDRLERATLAAATTLVEGRSEESVDFLRDAFEALTNAREQCHAPESFLFDLCLISPEHGADDLQEFLADPAPLNLLLSGEDLLTLTESHPAAIDALRAAVQSEAVEVVGGEAKSQPVPLVPVENWIGEFDAGRELYSKHLQTTVRTWCRRRYGLTTLLPMLLGKFGFQTALHFALDNGLYPDTETGLSRWEGCDGSEIDSVSRLPLAADSAASFLQLPVRLAETMQYDQIATLIFARWPKLRTPFLEDLLRMSRYAPVLGEFTTFRSIADEGFHGDHFQRHDEGDYLSPFLIERAAARKADPVGGFARSFERRARGDAALAAFGLTAVLKGQPLPTSEMQSLATRLRSSDGELEPDAANEDASAVESALTESAGGLATLLTGDSTAGSEQGATGTLLINTLPHPRTELVRLEHHKSAVGQSEGVLRSQLDHGVVVATVELPPSGFVWIPDQTPLAKVDRKSPPLAEEGLLRNERYEIIMNPKTGGVGRVKEHGRKPNRVSTQIAYRFAQEQRWTTGEEPRVREHEGHYSVMTCHTMMTTKTGPAVGEIVTQGDLVHPGSGEVLASYTQRVSLARGRDVLDIEIDLQPVTKPDADPWSNYYCLRTAWMDTTAAITRSVLGTAQGVRGSRIESPHYVEIADEDTRTTLLTSGHCAHRRSDARMLDTLLMAEGDTGTHFRFAFALEDACPMQAATRHETPVLQVRCSTPPPQPTGWLLRLSHRNVRLLGYGPVIPEPTRSSADSTEPLTDEVPFDGPVARNAPEMKSPAVRDWPTDGFSIRLQETEGRTSTCRLDLVRTPKFARLRDFTGKTTAVVDVTAEGVAVPLRPYEIVDVELRFGSV